MEEENVSKDISDEEYVRLSNLIKKVLKLLVIIDIGCHEMEILKIAEELGTTFYDSSYILIAKTKGIPLVTEDEKLRRKVEGRIETMDVEEVIKP
ncbi:MAG: type II toxin-antitoxin system VapC family toxin [Candidatus Bathyarchaeia archaeon]